MDFLWRDIRWLEIITILLLISVSNEWISAPWATTMYEVFSACWYYWLISRNHWQKRKKPNITHRHNWNATQSLKIIENSVTISHYIRGMVLGLQSYKQLKRTQTKFWWLWRLTWPVKVVLSLMGRVGKKKKKQSKVNSSIISVLLRTNIFMFFFLGRMLRRGLQELVIINFTHKTGRK